MEEKKSITIWMNGDLKNKILSKLKLEGKSFTAWVIEQAISKLNED